MTEEFLHYIWQFRLYKPDLSLVSGEHIQVLHPGEYNTNSGPDFFNARLKISDTVWAGNVEIHINASDWFRHNHHEDKAYDSIILHVVYNNDKAIFYGTGSPIPTLELAGFVDPQLWDRYIRFMASVNWIPCENMLKGIDTFTWSSWLDRLLVERMERKARQVEETLEASLNDWNQAFYRLLARNMGFKLNNDAFERLASVLSFKLLTRHSDNLFQLEALLFGQAGLLTATLCDSYPVKLREEYEFLQKKYNLDSLDSQLWRFMRIHPANFPTLRISQLAAIIHSTNGLLMEILETGAGEVIHTILDQEVSDYWNTHYRFDKPVKAKSTKLGTTAINLLAINLIAPFLFVYGRRTVNNRMVDRAIEILEETNGEDNSIIRQWERLGLDVSTAAKTQALLELKSNYCDRKKCLSCRIGLNLFREG